MNIHVRNALRHSLAAFACLTVPALARGQIISLKTVPVAAGDQFMVFPAHNLGMGGVSIALADEWLDPYVNPSLGSRLKGSRVFGSPLFYNISNTNTAARTLPVSVLFGSATWFGGGSLAMQQLDTGNDFFGGPIPLTIRDARLVPVPEQLLSDRTATNMYAFGLLGRKFNDGRTAIGASGFYGNLNAVDGVELLYALAQNIDQYGHVADVRFGLAHDLGGDRSLEVLALHNDFDMTHDVTYANWVWNAPCDTLGGPIPCPRFETRLENNRDHTRTWGLHARYQQPLTDTGWRLGAIFTTNYKTHPKIPNYEIMNIPRDPGSSWAYNAGIGLSSTRGPARFGFDLILEPIWSHTWAEADTAITTPNGRTIPAGGRTVENRFVFTNSYVRVGVAREDHRTGLQLGLQVRSISYRLEQDNLVTDSSRTQRENWMEWTPTWGGSLKFPEFEIRYLGRLTTGTGRPGVAWTGARGAGLEMAAAADIIVAPSGPLTLQDVSVVTHQIAVTLPIK
ncbi:MAG TPA: hypothetical protein VNL18_14335 [Gemmatimonadales bacterium]|nr:hypothetical protein [Gemmatimonadales bacterium]